MKSDYIIRQATVEDAAGIAEVHVDSWRTTYEGIAPADYLSELSYKDSEHRWRGRLEGYSARYAMFVAEDEDGQIVGFGDGGPERSGDPTYDGELYAIYLLEHCQRRGIGKRLFWEVVQHLRANHFQTMLIWVLTDNSSRHFYESLGGHLIREADIEIGGKRLREIAYGWSI